MGMTIDESLNLLNNSKPKSNNAFSIQMNEAINVIGATVRKYQKIQEIFYRYDKGELTHNMFGLLVGEVLEDGDDNN